MSGDAGQACLAGCHTHGSPKHGLSLSISTQFPSGPLTCHVVSWTESHLLVYVEELGRYAEARALNTDAWDRRCRVLEEGHRDTLAFGPQPRPRRAPAWRPTRSP